MIQAIKDAWRFIGPYWTSEERLKAWFLFAGILVSVLIGIYMQVLINEWQRVTFDALQNFKIDFFTSQLQYYFYILAGFVLAFMIQVYFKNKLIIAWRLWLTNHLLDKWLAHKNYYKMHLFKSRTDNPDQRISQDVSEFVTFTETVFIDSISKALTLVTFSTILWNLSADFPIPESVPLIGGKVFPGFLFWVAITYSLLSTYISFRFGSSLVKLMFNRERLEANFRFAMMRLRENTESIALYHAEKSEKWRFMGRYQEIVQNMYQVLFWNIRYFMWLNFSINIASVIPIMLVAPMYFARQVQFGGIMQIVSAMAQVQDSLLHFSQILPSLASWRAATLRLCTFLDDLDDVERKGKNASHIKQNIDSNIKDPVKADLESIDLPTGRRLLENVNVSLKAGQSVLLKGPSGCGKSTFLRVLAGLWPLGKGTVRMPESKHILFVPQRPYIPLGTLREVLLYPYQDKDDIEITDEALVQTLEKVGLSKFADQLDDDYEWSKRFSLGEQQKVSFARILLHKPAWVFMDEITSALDEIAEKYLYGLLKEECPGITLISVGHRSTIESFHENCLYFDNDNPESITHIKEGKLA